LHVSGQIHVVETFLNKKYRNVPKRIGTNHRLKKLWGFFHIFRQSSNTDAKFFMVFFIGFSTFCKNLGSEKKQPLEVGGDF